MKSGATRGQRAAGDPALAVAVVEERLVVSMTGLAAELERRVAREAVGMDQQPAQVDEVEEALLEAVGQRRELRQVGSAGIATRDRRRPRTCR